MIRSVRLSVIVTFRAVAGPVLVTSIAKVCTSPAGRLASVAVFTTEISAELPGMLPVTE